MPIPIACGSGSRVFALCGLAMLAHAATTPNVSISPSVSFGTQYVGKTYAGQTITVTNYGSSSALITSFAFTTSVFQWTDGQTMTLLANASTTFHVKFVPPAAGSYTGQFLVYVQGLSSPLSASLTGTAVTSAAMPALSTSSLTFNGTLGSAPVSQVVTVQNTGTANSTVSSIVIAPAQFTASAGLLPQTIKPGKSLNFTVSYTPAAVESVNGILNVVYKETPTAVLALSGSAAAPSSLAVTTFPTLPAGVPGAAYQAFMSAAAGTPPYSWSLAPGSVLPAGVTLQSYGSITGALDGSVLPGTYGFTVQVTDSGTPPGTSAAYLSFPVNAATGANCNNVWMPVAGGTDPLVPLDQLGSGLYLGYPGGLYPGAVNTIPAGDLASGVSLAQSIQPLDSTGAPSASGKYVLLALGTSAAKYEFDQFLTMLAGYPRLNPNLVVVEGAQGSETMLKLTTSLGSSMWNNILNFALPQSGVTSKQVVAVWLEGDDLFLPAFPGDAQTLQNEFETLAQQLLGYFPNVKLLYLAPRIYAGYSDGISKNNPEPDAYDQAFAIQWTIADQINGNPALNFDPSVGPVRAPWIGWSPYYWGNGLIPRNDGLTWSCPDFKPDGYHPEKPGDLKVVGRLLNFFVTDPTATPWFLAH